MTLIAAGDVVVPGRPARTPDVELPAATAVPGFVDMHIHGGGGSYTSGDVGEITRALALHRAHGTTTSLESLVTAGPADLVLLDPELRVTAVMTGGRWDHGEHLPL